MGEIKAVGNTGTGVVWVKDPQASAFCSYSESLRAMEIPCVKRGGSGRVGQPSENNKEKNEQSRYGARSKTSALPPSPKKHVISDLAISPSSQILRLRWLSASASLHTG